MRRALVPSMVTLFIWGTFTVVSCTSSKPIQPPPSPSTTVNPQGPSFLGWDGEPFEGSIDQLPTNPGDSATITSMGPGGKQYTITAGELDPCLPTSSEFPPGVLKLRLYTLKDSKGRNVCENQVYTNMHPGACEASAGAVLTGAAVAVPGRWDGTTGAFTSCATGSGGSNCFTVSCLTGAVGRCAHWGYVPTTRGNDGGVNLQRHHQACVRAARADYGSGAEFTCAKTYIDVIDGLGIQVQDPMSTTPPLAFEAAWDENGAVPFGVSPEGGPCVRPRFNFCKGEIDPVLHSRPGGARFNASDNCVVPSGSADLRSRFDGGVPFLLLTQTWSNTGCGGQCVKNNPAACPADDAYGPKTCKDAGP